MSHEQAKMKAQEKTTDTVQKIPVLSKKDIIERMRDDKQGAPFNISAEITNLYPQFSSHESVLDLYPRFIQKEVLEYMKGLKNTFKELGNAEEKELFEAAQNEAAHIWEDRYQFDSKTQLENKEYIKKLLTDITTEQLRDGSNDSFRHIARFSIDLNGMKTVNDLNKGQHSVGDEFLLKIADWLRSSAVLKKLRTEGVRITEAREGGDEFSLIAMSTPDNEFDWDKIALELEKEIQHIDFSNVIDPKIIQEVVPNAPKDCRFRATIAVGVATLEDALNETAQDDKNEITISDNPNRIVEKTMGALLDVADRRMQARKKQVKDSLREGNPHDQALYELLLRTDEQRKLEDEILSLKKENELLKKKLSDCVAQNKPH